MRTRRKPPDRKQTTKPAGRKPNPSARECWAAPHVHDGKPYPAVPDPAKWLSTAEACELLGVSRKTIQKRISAGLIATKQHGYYLLLSAADVKKLAA